MDTTTGAPEVEPSSRGQNVRRGPTPAPESAINNTTENSLKTSALRSPICFRIRGIPPHWESEDVMEHLKSHMQIDSELDWKAARLSGPFPSPFEDRQCALLNLDRCTDYLGTMFSVHNSEDYSVVEVNQKIFRMVIDRHFNDLTLMNKPSLPIVADVIAITGLGGHAFGSWRSRRRTSRPIERPMWIRDFLPERFPNTRIMTYGYNCSLVNPNETRLMDYTHNLNYALLNARRDCKDRKIIFIGHSLGALLIIQLLVQWSNDKAQNHLRDCVRGIFLFGAPHEGMDATDLYSLVEEDTDGQKCAGLLAQLKAGSEFLVNQRISFVNVVEELRGVIYSFFETQKTEKVTPRVDPEAKEYVERVNRFSAQLFLPKERRIQVDSNHTDMVKLSSAEDHIFQTIVTGISSCLPPTGDSYESILRGLSWALARKEVWPNSVDPSEGETLCDFERLERSKEYCWLFHNPDYEQWSKEDNGFKVLVVGGHNNLSPLTSYHQHMSKVQGPCLSLCFSSGPTGVIKDAHVVWELLRQAMDTCSQEQQGFIFNQFLKRLRECNPNHEQVGLASSPNVRLQKILDASQSSELWSALGSAIGTIARYPDKAIARSLGGRFKSLTIILYLNEAERNVYRPVLESIQILRGYVERSGSFDRVRVLILSEFLNGENEHYDSEYFISYRIYVMGRQGCLRSLAFQNTRYEKISPHQAHTFDWLCRTNEYMSWNTRYDPCLLLIEGKPGSGKSTLMRYIKKNVKPAGKDAIIGSFFYSARDGTAESSHLNMLKALLHSILEADETFFVHFQKTYVKQRRGDISRGWEIEELKQIMLDACTNHPFPSTIYWVIDALDESDNTNSSRIEIVQHFEKVLDAARNNKRLLVKIVLGSRPLNELQDMCRISLQEKTKGDIQKYTTARLNDKVFTKCDMSLRKEFEDYIVTTADGVFLWVRLVIDELGKQVRNGSSINNLLGLLKSLPKDLESFYEHIFKELKKCRDANELIAGGRILGLCLLSHRAIELGELRDALALFDNQTQSEPESTRWEQNRSVNIRNLVTCCAGGYVDIKDRKNGFSVAQLMHQTVREFLKSPPEIMIGTPFNITDYAEVSLRIGLMCVEFLEIMCVELKPGGKGYPISTEYLNDRPLLKYSVEYFLENRDFIDARTEARLKKLIERLNVDLGTNVDLGSNGDLGSNARILLWKLVEPESSDDIKYKLGTLLLDAARNGHAIAISNLLAFGADTEFRAPVNQDRALHFAARGGHESAAILLLDGDANIDSRNILDATPLYMAAAAGQMALFDLLLSYGANPSCRSSYPWSLLETAAANGRFNIIQRLFQDDLATPSDDFSRNTMRWALGFALQGGYDDIVTKLLQPDLRFWEKNASGLDIFSFAAIGGSEITIKKLLDLAGPPEDKNQNYDEYIKLGRLYGNNSSVELFTKLAGAKSVDKSYLTGESLYTGGPEKDDIAKFYTAAAHDHSVVIVWLILRGLDITTCSYCDNRYPALHHLILSGAYESCHRLIYCRDRASITDRDWSGSTPLHLAVGKNFNNPLADALMDTRADTEAVDNNGETPLHYAARGGSRDACLFLLRHRASLEATDKNGSTPLHMAAMSGHLEICTLLVSHGANRSAFDLNGLTPSGVALQAGFENIASFLSRPDEDNTSDEDSTSVTDSDGSDPPCPGSATWPEEHLTSSPGPVHLVGPGGSSNISSAPLEEVYGIRPSNEHHSSTHLRSKATSMTELDDVREDEPPPASRRRPRSSGDIVKDSTEGVKPKRRRNADEGI